LFNDDIDDNDDDDDAEEEEDDDDVDANVDVVGLLLGFTNEFPLPPLLLLFDELLPFLLTILLFLFPLPKTDADILEEAPKLCRRRRPLASLAGNLPMVFEDVFDEDVADEEDDEEEAANVILRSLCRLECLFEDMLFTSSSSSSADAVIASVKNSDASSH
jgi:hypothetical protein